MPYLMERNENVLGNNMQWPRMKLTSEQNKKWIDTRTALMWSQPSFADIWYAMMVDAKGETAWFTDKIPSPAATDDHYMYINPEPFFGDFILAERMFICCHEILHATLGHCTQLHRLIKAEFVRYADGVSLPMEVDIFQRAMDAVINSILKDANVGQAPQGAVFDANVNANMSVLDAYRVMYKNKPGGGGKSGKPGKGKGQGGKGSGSPSPSEGQGDGFDTHLAPGQAEGKGQAEAESERNETEWRTAVASAIASSKLRGTLPAALDRLFAKIMQPEVDWVDLLRSAITRKLGNGSGSWDQLDHGMVIRGIGAPGRIAWGAGYIVAAVDTSGSITQKMMDRFMSELGGILDDVRPKRLTLAQCDAAVHEWVDCDDSSDLMRKIKGGGGTDFVPVFDKIRQEDTPDLLVYFTDGYGRFPVKPDYPVVWANITKDGEKLYPWGDIVFVPLRYMESE